MSRVAPGPAPIRTRPAAWATSALRAYVRRSVRRQFHGWHLGGPGLEAPPPSDAPLLFVANHTSWWDGFFALMLAERLGHQAYVMMQADQLARAPFFARCGAFSVERGDARQAEEDLVYAAGLLRPGNGVWIFPQGRRAPANAPLVLASGAARLARAVPGTLVVPVAFRYGFLSEERPEAFAWVERPAPAAAESLGAERRRQRGALEHALARLDAELATGERAGFAPLIAGAPSSNKRLEALLARLGLADARGARNG